jgi:hypothetical protein
VVLQSTAFYPWDRVAFGDSIEVWQDGMEESPSGGLLDGGGVGASVLGNSFMGEDEY